MANELVLFADPIKELPAEKIPAWLTLGRGKMVLEQGLTKYGLELSGILNGYEKHDKKNVPELTKKLASYREKQGQMVEFRKLYTVHLNSIVSKCMEPEKAADPANNETYKLAAALELNLRKEAQADDSKKQQKATEAANLTAHIKNEYYRIIANYRAALKIIISDAYMQCLDQRVPADNVHTAITAAKSAMKDVRPEARAPFKLTLHNVDEAKEIQGAIPDPDYATVWRESLAELTEKFSLYANDLANAPQAVQDEKAAITAELTEINNDTEATAAATTLMENATAYVAPMAGLKVVEEKKKIKICGQDQKWVTAIMAAFLNNFVKAFPKIRNTDYSKLTIAQMAAALDAAEIKVLGIEYEIIEK